MGFRLSRTSPISDDKKSISITASENTVYDLDQIKANKSRSGDSDLIVNVTDRDKYYEDINEGEISIKKTEDKIIANTTDSIKYLFKNEPSSDAYTPDVTLRRPIVLWEEGTPDTNDGTTGDDIQNQLIDLDIRLTNTRAELKDEIKNLSNDITDDISELNNSLNQKITKVEANLVEKIDGLESTLNNKIDTVNSSLQTEIDNINTYLENISIKFMSNSEVDELFK